MKRQDKYPNTNSFYFHNENPKNKYTSDCVIRAIAVGTNQEYAKVLRDLTELQIKTGYDMSDPKCYSKYLKCLGWTKCSQPKKPNGKKYTGVEFCEDCERAGENTVIAHIGGNHIVAIIWGQVWDTWNSTGGCIGNYWVPYKR